MLSVNINDFQYKQQVSSDISVGETFLKGMVSYYNSQVCEWEPLIEKTKIHLKIERMVESSQTQVLLSFKRNLNINITDMLMQTLTTTYQSL